MKSKIKLTILIVGITHGCIAAVLGYLYWYWQNTEKAHRFLFWLKDKLTWLTQLILLTPLSLKSWLLIVIVSLFAALLAFCTFQCLKIKKMKKAFDGDKEWPKWFEYKGIAYRFKTKDKIDDCSDDVLDAVRYCIEDKIQLDFEGEGTFSKAIIDKIPSYGNLPEHKQPYIEACHKCLKIIEHPIKHDLIAEEKQAQIYARKFLDDRNLI